MHFQVISLPVRNVRESLAWYQEMFGFPLSWPVEEGDQEAWMDVKGVGFGLVESEELPRLEFSKRNGEKLAVLTLQTDGIHDLHRKLKDNGVTVSEITYKPGGGYAFTFEDLNGHAIGIWGGWPKE